MANKLLDLKGVKLTDITKEEKSKISNISRKDVAIIGLSCTFAEAKDASEFWNILENGKDCVRDIPETRKADLDMFFRLNGDERKNVEYSEIAYMDEIDKFDYAFFNISPTEAGLMDPNQRLFLQTAFKASEDAGYGGDKLFGSNTGIYVGHSTDFGYEYKNLISAVNPEEYSNAIPGNVKSIIGSRISYIMDLKGPSIVVDTACSSSLVAVHLACQGLRNGECDMAIAGGVKFHLLPLKNDGSIKLGIESSDNRARTFDDSSDGTGFGEGVGAVVLKPLNKALEDGDNIYAVIKGSAYNQDGSSVGITAPNAQAQQDVILAAWKDAGISPDTVTLLEAHGTGTKLGDPVEISGIQKAFKHYTDRKQFCAIGSVKTNIGHLDSLAGIAGLIKAVLALKNKKIPPNIHFNRPNSKISFEDSPVYVNDILSDWETEGFPRRCGVSAFGLSGTNCHVVLEEAPAIAYVPAGEKAEKINIFNLSAKNRESLAQIISNYKGFLADKKDLCLEELCNTANIGRSHYNFRISILARNLDELKFKINKLAISGPDLPIDGVYFGAHKLITVMKENRRNGEITEDEKRQLSQKADLLLKDISLYSSYDEKTINGLCSFYINGADIKWEELYKESKVRKLSLPGYPFLRNKCWVEPNERLKNYNKTQPHPLFDHLVADTVGVKVYSTLFSPDRHWVVNEHKVLEEYVVPGTTYLEMARELGDNYYNEGYVHLRDVLFLSPMVVKEGELKNVQSVVKEEEGFLSFTIAAKSVNGDSWNKYVEGKIYNSSEKNPRIYDIEQIKSRLTSLKVLSKEEEQVGAIVVGPRWDSLKEVYIAENEALARFELPLEYESDLKEYVLHPALMDRAANLAIRAVGEGLYLPFSYKSFKVFGPTPRVLYSHLIRKDDGKQNKETARFDVLLLNENGEVFGEVEDYYIKKVHIGEFKYQQTYGDATIYYETLWKLTDVEKKDIDLKGCSLVLMPDLDFAEEVVSFMKEMSEDIIEIRFGESFERLDENKYVIKNTVNDFKQLLEEMKDRNIDRILHMATLKKYRDISDTESLEKELDTGVISLFNLSKAFADCKYDRKTDLFLISENIHEVTGYENGLNPHNAALFGLGKVVGQENTNIVVKCIDIDDATKAMEIVREIALGGNDLSVSYRNGLRYLEELSIVYMQRIQAKGIQLKDTGVYIITGGTGGLGLETGKNLSSMGKVNLCLINRTEMPPREEWDLLLGNPSTEKKLLHKIRSIMEMEQTGANVTCVKCDVSEEKELVPAINELRGKFGRINGVIHCAGIAGDGFIFRKEEETFKKVMGPKVQGTLLLDRITRQDDPDFFVLFSSINAVIGVAGQGDYTAANSYLDAYSVYRNKLGMKTLSINWPAWQETGMAVDYGVNEVKGFFKPIPTVLAINAFRDAIERPFKRIIVGELNLEFDMDYIDKMSYLRLSDETRNLLNKIRKKSSHAGNVKYAKQSADAVVKGRDGNDYKPNERKLAQIWAEVLGLGEIDIYDSLFELGGDSILALRIANRINEVTGISLNIGDLFEHMTVYELARFLDEKTGGVKKQADYARMNQSGSSLMEDMEDYNESMNYELTHAQKRMWFMQKYDPDMTVYNLPVTGNMTNTTIDVQNLQKAINTLIHRHTSLRTIFKEVNGEPRQFILPHLELSVEMLDLSEEENKEKLLADSIASDNKVPFDLSGPLVKSKLYKMSEGNYKVYMNIHHIITDGWSINMFFKELFETYMAIMNGKEADATPLRPGYLDYLRQQKMWEKSDDFRKTEEYWLNEISKPVPVLNLPTDYKRPEMMTYNGSFIKFRLNREQTGRLKEMAKKLNSTLNMVLLAEYLLLLQKVSNEKDIIVGMPITGRDTKEAEKIFGLFINTICIRVQFDGINTFKELVDYVKNKNLNAYRHSKYPFELLVNNVNPDRDTSRSPIVSTMFQIYDNMPPEFDGVSMFELSFMGREWENGMEVRVEFNTDLFKRETAKKLTLYFISMIEKTIRNPFEKLADINLLNADELQEITSRILQNQEELDINLDFLVE
jgi:iturin family lipopeptide synthetase A